uniref:Neur_chan_memb domain-containing protein n=1 Tax=Macrostomum lignano TaxID=282301 RepID=A0A1I8IUI5_9PLAT
TCQAMDVWMSICLLFVFASLLEFAVVNVFSRKEIRKKSQGLNILSETAKNFEEMMMRSDESGIGAAGSPPTGPFSAYSRRQAHKRREEMRQRARVIDKLARKLFPLAFVLFNVVYWIGYNLCWKNNSWNDDGWPSLAAQLRVESPTIEVPIGETQRQQRSGGGDDGG